MTNKSKKVKTLAGATKGRIRGSGIIDLPVPKDNILTKAMKNKSKLKEFSEFLAEECYDLDKYKAGKYDRKIFNWFKQALKETYIKVDGKYVKYSEKHEKQNDKQK